LQGITINQPNTIGNIENIKGDQHFALYPAIIESKNFQNASMAEQNICVFKISFLTKEQILRFVLTRKSLIQSIFRRLTCLYACSYTYAFTGIQYRLRAMLIFNSLRASLLNAGDIAIFQATGWNENGDYVYRVSRELHN
jgi:hypothetical protein